MLTTKKWGSPSEFQSPAESVSGRDGSAPASSAPGRFLVILTALTAILLAGCEPPGPAALRRGERLIQEGRPQQAIEPLRRAVTLFATNAPAAAQAWNFLGLAYHRNGQPHEAALSYQNALVKDHNLAVVRYNRGVLFLEQNNFPDAINELTTYTTLRPTHADAWLRLGLAQLRARQLEVADRSFQQVFRIESTPVERAEAFNNLGLIQALRRRPREAFQHFRDALREKENYAPALLNQAIVAQAQMGDRRNALDRYQAYLRVAGAVPDRWVIEAQIARLEAELRPPVVPTNLVTAPLPDAGVQPRLPTNALAVLAPQAPLPTVQTTPPPVLVQTTPPPVMLVQTSVPPPALVRTSPPPVSIQTAAPPVIVAVEPPPVRTEIPEPTPVATSAPPVRPMVPVPAVAVAPATNAIPAAVLPETPKEESVVEMVTIDPDPEVRPARDLTPPRPVPMTARVPEASPTAESRQARTIPVTEPKRSVWSRLNPVEWFSADEEEKLGKQREKAAKEERKRAEDAARVRATPLPTPAPGARTPAPVTNAPAPVEVVEPPPAQELPRYAYRSPTPATTGDRAAARPAFEEALQAHRAGRYGDAVRAYRRAVESAPNYFEAWSNLGAAAQQEGNGSEALRAFEQALTLRPDDVTARYNLGVALDRAGYPLDAAAEFEKVLRLDAAYPDAHLNLGGLYAGVLQNKALAREHYRRLLELAPRHPQAAEVRRWLSVNR
ncbi:MAG: tetratricopeptide repeat protein [Limisphaerales bacterium]